MHGHLSKWNINIALQIPANVLLRNKNALLIHEILNSFRDNSKHEGVFVCRTQIQSANFKFVVLKECKCWSATRVGFNIFFSLSFCPSLELSSSTTIVPIFAKVATLSTIQSCTKVRCLKTHRPCLNQVPIRCPVGLCA